MKSLEYQHTIAGVQNLKTYALLNVMIAKNSLESQKQRIYENQVLIPAIQKAMYDKKSLQQI